MYEHEGSGLYNDWWKIIWWDLPTAISNKTWNGGSIWKLSFLSRYHVTVSQKCYQISFVSFIEWNIIYAQNQ